MTVPWIHRCDLIMTKTTATNDFKATQDSTATKITQPKARRRLIVAL